MQRKRGGLVPIGEVSSLDDDTPPGHSAVRRNGRSFTLADQDKPGPQPPSAAATTQERTVI